MKLIPLVAAIFSCFLAGCDYPKNSSVELVDPGLRIVQYEGHQYMFYKVGYGAGLCHLESCTNRTHGK